MADSASGVSGRGGDTSGAALIALVRTWRRDETAPLACPSCGGGPVEIADRSARPHREWYAVTCPACGLSKTVAVALGAPVPGTD